MKSDENLGNTEGRNGYGPYVYVWVALLALLGLNIIIGKIAAIHYRALIILFVAGLMAVLDLAYFMNLRLEGKFLRNVFLLALLALTCIIVLTFSDVWYR